METGWNVNAKNEDTYVVVKPLNNGANQSLYIFTEPLGGGRWNIAMGVFSSHHATMFSLLLEESWDIPASTNLAPSLNTLKLALDGLKEIEEELKTRSNGKRRIVYIDGLDERRLRTYTKVLNKVDKGYKTSSAKSRHCDLYQLYKVL